LEGFDVVTSEQELEFLRRLLGWVFERTRHGCSSFKRSERDAALSDVNYWTEEYRTHYTGGRIMPISRDRVWCGETP
jgi:hypothetical protein